MPTTLPFGWVPAAQNAASNAAQAKEAARTNLETVLRVLVRKIQGTPAVTNAQRESLGLSLRGQARTAVDAPTTRPVLPVDTSQRLRHTGCPWIRWNRDGRNRTA